MTLPLGCFCWDLIGTGMCNLALGMKPAVTSARHQMPFLPLLLLLPLTPSSPLASPPLLRAVRPPQVSSVNKYDPPLEVVAARDHMTHVVYQLMQPQVILDR